MEWAVPVGEAENITPVMRAVPAWAFIGSIHIIVCEADLYILNVVSQLVSQFVC